MEDRTIDKDMLTPTDREEMLDRIEYNHFMGNVFLNGKLQTAEYAKKIVQAGGEWSYVITDNLLYIEQR